jgi:hypothetical protein
MATAVWVYPEKNYEKLGTERWQASWEQIKKSAAALCRVKDCALNVALYFLFSILRSSRISIEGLSLRKRAFGNYGVSTVTLLLFMFTT